MKVGPTKSGSSRPFVSTGAVREAGRAYAVRAVADASAPAPSADVTTIAGIPGNELTPKVRDAIELLMHEVQRMRQELEQAEKRVAFLEKLADEDSLVPVSNRRAFVRELSRVVAYSERYDSVSSVLYFDIDGFKQINDQYGHAAGDAALQHIAEIFTLNVRESDVVGRLGGDEFGVILAQSDAATAAEKAMILAQAIETTPAEPDPRRRSRPASPSAPSPKRKRRVGPVEEPRCPHGSTATRRLRSGLGSVAAESAVDTVRGRRTDCSHSRRTTIYSVAVDPGFLNAIVDRVVKPASRSIGQRQWVARKRNGMNEVPWIERVWQSRGNG